MSANSARTQDAAPPRRARTAHRHYAFLISLAVVVIGCGEGARTSRSPQRSMAPPTQGTKRIDPSQLISWGDGSAKWEQELAISNVRVGCTDPPSTCVGDAESRVTARGANHVFVSMLGAGDSLSETAADFAREYSKLSLGRPWLVEVGIDDFADLYSAQGVADPASLLDLVIRNLKTSNPNLKFGVTVYEFELASPYLRDAHLPSSLRGQVDYVHLYVTYRQNAPRYEAYVQQAKDTFPNARIVAGSYPQDRIDFVPCSESEPHKLCTVEQEAELFKQLLEIQIRLLENGGVDAIEFFSDGNFSYPQTATSSACKPERTQECISNTEYMRDLAVALLANPPRR